MTDFLLDLYEKLKNPVFRKNYNRVHLYDDIASQVLRLRSERKLTQKELAEKMGTIQAVISRIENGSSNSSLKTLQRIAEELDAVLQVNIIREEDYRFDEFLLLHSCSASEQKQELIHEIIQLKTQVKSEAENGIIEITGEITPLQFSNRVV